MPSSRPFVPLNVHSEYTLLEASSRVKDIIKIAKENDMPAIGLSDQGVMYGAIDFYSKAKEAGLNPLVGCEMFVVDGDPTDRAMKQSMYNVVLTAKNYQGYQNLSKIVSYGHLEGFYYKPRINWDFLKEHSEGLIATSACLRGPIAHPVLRGNPQAAFDRAKQLKDMFGPDFYLEMQDHDQDPERQVAMASVEIAKQLNIPLIATNDSRYSYPGQNQMLDILLCMQQGKTITDTDRMRTYGPEYYVKNGDQMAQLFQYLDRDLVNQAIENTVKLAETCNLELPLGQSILPDFPLPPGVTPAEALRQTVEEHAIKRFGKINDEVRHRLEFELNIINQMGFPAYFLIVWDFINYARNNNIPVGPGRGSAAGSLVAYCLGITNIDPLEHNLLFERFLNPERVSMPDIDIDFCIDRRDQVIQYVRNRYGEERVCQIITFGTLAAKASLKAVARVMDIPYAESDRLAKMIPGIVGTKLADALADGMPLQKEVENNPQAKELVDLALLLEGNTCNTGVHAAGVVIAKDPLNTVMPLQRAKDGNIVSQFPMGDLEKLGLLKMDFLGLRNLTIIDNAEKLIAQTGVTCEVDDVSLKDEAVYEVLTSGDTDGVFQLESGGMKALVRDLKPNVFEDINALVALYRPGPLNSGMVKSFVDRKHGREAVTYEHESLKPILEPTYGTIVYQEQIMQIAQTLAGYSLGQADLLRRAMGKKKADVMAKEEAGFVAGAIEKGFVGEEQAKKLFATMSEFAAYCFNRSHSAAYAMISYQTAYLKTHYPVEYFCALLSSVSNDLDKIRHYIQAARRLGIQVLPPDVQQSGADFTPDRTNPDRKAIRFGLASIKNVGSGVVDSIIEVRNEKPFEDLEDFFSRLDPKALNRKTLESLIRSGAFDSFGKSRKHLFENIDGCVSYAQDIRDKAETGQSSLFDLMTTTTGSVNGFSQLMLMGDATVEWPQEMIQDAEKELLGVYVSSHPLDEVRESLPLMISHSSRELLEMKDEADGITVVLGGMLADLKKKMTKKNRPICIGNIEDLEGQLEFVAFSDTVEALEANQPELLQDGRRVLLVGNAQIRGDDNETVSVILREIKPLEAVHPVMLHFEAVPKYEDLVYVAQLLAANSGNTAGTHPVIVGFSDGTKIKTNPRYWIHTKRAQIVGELRSHFGESISVN